MYLRGLSPIVYIMFLTHQSVLVVIDVQGQLAQKMHNKIDLFHNLQSLIALAKHLGIPIIYTEQSPEKIGTTAEDISNLLTDITPISKTTFSCCGEEKFLKVLRSLKRNQIIVSGIEAHVCVFQTVYDLIQKKYAVQVVADAVSSRSPEHTTIAIERMRSSGATITCAQMLATELLRDSKHPKFREILSLIR